MIKTLMCGLGVATFCLSGASAQQPASLGAVHVAQNTAVKPTPKAKSKAEVTPVPTPAPKKKPRHIR